MDLFVCTNRGSEQQILRSEFSGVLPLAHYIQLRVICDMQPVYTESQGKKHTTHMNGTTKQVTKQYVYLLLCRLVFSDTIHNVDGISITNRNMHSYMPTQIERFNQ